MRNHGTRIELVHLRPHDHIGWAYSGEEEFIALATAFLAEASSRERLMYVAESPDVAGALAPFVASIDPERLQVASVTEVYGTSGCVDAVRQRATFSSALAAALADGYEGIRVAADNTSLVVDPRRRDAWIRWEHVADHFMAEHPVTGLCAFDRERIDVDVLRHLATLHPLSSADSPAPQFRLFVDAGALWVEGEVNPFAMDEAAAALENVPSVTQVIVDLTATALLTGATLARIRRLSETGINVTVLTPSSTEHENDIELDRATPGVSWVRG